MSERMGNAPVIILVLVLLVSAAVIGYLNFQNQQNQQSQLQQAITQTTEAPTPTTIQNASPTAQLDETSNWQTYTNTKFHFQMQYPPDWSVFAPGPIEVSDGPTFQTTDCFKLQKRCGTLQVTINPIKTSLSPAELLNQMNSAGFGLPTVVNIKQWNAGNISGYEGTYTDNESGDESLHMAIFFSRNTNLYFISYNEGYYQSNYGIKSPSDWQLLPIVNQMVSMFTFTK